jgi:hypothetical protein
VFVFHPGHWGSTVGYYGGVNYGHGYFGDGYSGGHWIGNSFAYNSAVNRVDAGVVRHVYAESVPGQAPRGVSSYTVKSRNVDSSHTVSQHRSPPAAVNRTTSGIAIEGAGERAPVPTTVDKPATANKTPAAGAAPKSTHVTPSRPAPIK